MPRTQRKSGGGRTFEQSLERLEQIVETLENGEIPLEDSLRMYEEGIQLSKECMKKLSEAELRIQKLTGKNLEDFDVSDLDKDL